MISVDAMNNVNVSPEDGYHAHLTLSHFDCSIYNTPFVAGDGRCYHGWIGGVAESGGVCYHLRPSRRCNSRKRTQL